MEHMLRATAKAEARHFWFRGFRFFVTPLIRRAIEARSDARILDCGCGTGANVELLKRFGEAYGFDLSETGLQIAREEGRTRLARARITAVPFPSESFDLVTSFDVLYALDEADEKTAVAEMFRLARPGGFAVINVAAMDILRGDHSVLCHEVRRYTRGRLQQLLSDAGFEIVRLTYTNQTLFIPLLVVRTLQRWRGLASETEGVQELSVPPAPVNALLTALLWVENLALRWSDAAPFGSSLLCLARKPL